MFYLGQVYTTTEAGEYCAEGENVTTEEECRKAAEELGVTFAQTYDGPSDWQYCMLQADTQVFFNAAANGGASNPQDVDFRRSICKSK